VAFPEATFCWWIFGCGKNAADPNIQGGDKKISTAGRGRPGPARQRCPAMSDEVCLMAEELEIKRRYTGPRTSP